jgi:phospholipid/cholesterol/gamma-HCH transport system substrate-binding protein
MMSASAEFADVGALAPRATVEMAGVNIGYVSRVSVDGAQARVTLRFPRSAHVPANVVAQVRRAAVLGPQLIELIVPTAHSGQPVPLLADNQRIATTVVRPDLEDLVRSGTDLIGALSTSELARVLQAGAQGFGGRGAQLHQAIDDLDVILAGYASRTQEITKLLGDIDTLTSSIGPAAQADAEALGNLARATAVLDDQRQRLVDLLSSLDRASQQGIALLSTELPQIADQLVMLRSTTQALANQQVALGRLLVYLQGHNATLSEATVNNFVQVLNDFVICGVPGGGEDKTSPLNSCTNVPAPPAP